MRKTIRSLSLVMVFCLLAAFLPALSKGGTTVFAAGDFTIKDGVLTKYNGSGGNVVIPDGVTEIGDYSFQLCEALTGITIPASVKRIGYDAFYGTDLTGVTIPASVTEIAGNPFDGPNFTAISVASGNADFTSADGVLYNKAKTKLIVFPAGKKGTLSIPASVTEIGSDAFRKCTGLTGVTIPASVTELYSYVFSDCTALESIQVAADNTAYVSIDGLVYTKDLSTLFLCPPGKKGTVTIPASVEETEWGVFTDCAELTAIQVENGNSSFSSKNGLLYDGTGTTLMLCPRGKKGAFSVPDGTKKIAGRAFADCTGLTGIALPDTVTEIGWSAFAHCTGLTSLTVPKSVTTLGEGWINNCDNLTELKVDSGNPNYTVSNGILYNKAKTEMLYCLKNKKGAVVIPDTMTSVPDYLFWNCTGLTSVTIPKSVTYIGDFAFSNCTGLTSITIPDSVTGIGYNAFEGCTGLKSITVPNAIDTIGYWVFCGCTGLRSVSLPDSLQGIGDGAFKGCTALTDVTIPDGVSFIGAHAFFGCTGLTSITLPASAEYIIEYAFYGCDSLKDVYYHNAREQWEEINLQEGNDPLVNARRHCTNDPAAITAQPADASGAVGDKVSFSVEAEGNNLSYQWYYKKANESSFTAWNGKTSASVSTPVYASWHNAQFYCMISDDRGNALTSDTAKLTVLPAITQQPKDVSGAVGDTAAFTVKATGVGLTYQWYYNKSGGNDVTAWSRNASASTPIYASWNGTTFYCVVTDANGNTLYSDPAMLTVLPKITQQPKDASGKVNDTAAFTVKATGTGLTYQWYMKKTSDSAFSAWNKKTTASVSTPIYNSWNGAQFYCVVKDVSGRTVKSNTVKLTVTAAAAEGPEIHSQPVDANGKVGNTVSFVVQTWDREATFQWYYRKKGESDFTLWKGQTKPTAVLTVYASWNQAEFYCILTGANGGTRKTDTVKLIVVPVFTEQPKNVSGAVNANATFTVKATGAGLSYQWYYKKAGQENATKWNGKTSASVSTPIYASWNNAQIYCVITDANGRTVKSNAAMLTVLPAITTQPVSVSGAVGDTATFSVKATGAGLSYQWYIKKATESSFSAWNNKKGASISTPVYASWNNAQFYCVVKDANGKTVQSNTVKLTVK